jgi:IS1 family transposase
LNIGTPYHRLQHRRATFDEVATLSVEGLHKSAIARVKRIAWNTVRRWLEKAARCCSCFNDRKINGIAITELQTDEIRTIIHDKDQSAWIFATIEVWSRLWPSTVVGRRSYRNTLTLFRNISSRTSLERVPLITTDGFPFYAKVIRCVFGPACLYGQVIKIRRNDRIVKVERRAVIGADWRLEKMLADSEDSSKLNTSFIERLNLTIRQGSAYLFRRTILPCAMEGAPRRSPRVASLLLQLCKASQGAEIRTRGPDASHAGRIVHKAADVQRDLFLDDAFFSASKCHVPILRLHLVGQCGRFAPFYGGIATLDGGSTVGVIRVDDRSGKPIAILVNYACHPVVFGPDNLRYSADYPGAMARTVDSALAGSPICFFLQGAPGDINPFMDKTPLAENADRVMVETGVQLGQEVTRVAKTIRAEVPARPSLKANLDVLHFKLRWDRDKLLKALSQLVGEATAKRYAPLMAEPMEAPVMTILINNEIALAGMPGEPFVDFQIGFRERSPVRSNFFVGHSNGYLAYFPTIRAAVEGGYGANSVTTRTEVGAGETMLDHSIITLYKMLGKLKDTPSQ